MSDQTQSCHSSGECCCPVRATLLILAGLLVAVVLAHAMVRLTRPAPIEADRAALRAKTLADLRAANAEALTTYGWVDQSKGIVRLPIERAMELTLQEWQNPAAARAALIEREEKAAAPAPAPPPPPSQFE
jgi:hypothetical protein